MVPRILFRIAVVCVLVAATLTAGAWIGTAQGLDPGPGSLRFPVMLAVTAVPITVVGLLGCTGGFRLVLACVAWAVLSFGQLTIMMAASDAVLGERGRPVTATVTQLVGHDLSEADGDYLYRVADRQGRPLAGLLRTPHQHGIGSAVTVLVDPAGWAHPTEPSTYAEGTNGVTLLVLAGMFGGPATVLYVLSCLPADRRREDDRDGTGPAPWHQDAFNQVVRSA
ncbi:hypothetical protein [Catellatospora chokoriensis]|uniref:hypothetical protein n=1 Tax=Catellatospora chokoriensis TaxID=310353 RepID=UPI00177C02AE|nr:hypothetical protein [Catellatospora chokoriensis]